MYFCVAFVVGFLLLILLITVLEYHKNSSWIDSSTNIHLVLLDIKDGNYVWFQPYRWLPWFELRDKDNLICTIRKNIKSFSNHYIATVKEHVYEFRYDRNRRQYAVFPDGIEYPNTFLKYQRKTQSWVLSLENNTYTFNYMGTGRFYVGNGSTLLEIDHNLGGIRGGKAMITQQGRLCSDINILFVVGWLAVYNDVSSIIGF